MDFTEREMDLLIEALTRAASRQDSLARFYPTQTKRHEAKARAMRQLQAKLAKLSTYGRSNIATRESIKIIERAIAN